MTIPCSRNPNTGFPESGNISKIKRIIMCCRKSVLRHVIPFDEGITLHRALGAVLALAALGHTFAHVCNYRHA